MAGAFEMLAVRALRGAERLGDGVGDGDGDGDDSGSELTDIPRRWVSQQSCDGSHFKVALVGVLSSFRFWVQ